MKNKYTFSKYFKEQMLPAIAMFLIGLIILTSIGFLIIYIAVKMEYVVYALIFGLLAFAIIDAIYDNYQDCKEKYYQDKRNK